MPLQDLTPTKVLPKFQEDGFLLLKISTEAQQTIHTTIEAARDFFQSTLSLKIENSLPGDMGYRAFGKEYSSHSPLNPDQMESFSASARALEAASHLKSDQARLLYAQMLEVLNVFETIAEAVTMQLAKNISGRHFGAYEGAFRLWSFLQLNYSRPHEVEKDLINECHEDGCLITIISTTGPGLEVQTAGGKFVPIQTDSDEVLAMPGEILWLLSGGSVQPLYHRVRTERSCRERLSLLFFGDIDPRLCKPWIKNNVNNGIDIGELVLKNPSRFGLQEWKV